MRCNFSLQKINLHSFTAKVAFFSLLFICSHRFLLENYSLILGHNWDFTFPESDFLYERVQDLGLHSFSQIFGFNPLLHSQLPVNYLFGSLIKYTGINYSERILLLICHSFSFLSFSIYLKNYNFQSTERYFTSLFYAFSPYLFSVFIGGSWYAWISYSFAPLLINYLIQYLITGKSKFFFFIAVIQTLCVAYIQYWLIAIFISLVIALSINRLNFKYAFRFATCMLFITLVNFYWILPVAYYINDIKTQFIDNISLVGSFESIRASTQDIFNIVFITGFDNRNFYIDSMYIWERVLYIVSLSVCYIGIVKSKINYKRKYFYSVLLTLIVSGLVVKGSNFPFEDLTIWLYEHISILKIYRSPQNSFFIVVIIITSLLAIAFKYFSNYSVLYSYILIALMTIGWWSSGDIGATRLASQNKSHIEYYNHDNQIDQIIDFLKNSNSTGDITFIPFDKSVKYSGQYGGQGGEPNIIYLKNYSMHVLSDPNLFNDSILRENKLDTRLLADFNIEFLIHRKDFSYHFSPIANSQLVDAINNTNKILLVKSGKNYDVYKNLDYDKSKSVRQCFELSEENSYSLNSERFNHCGVYSGFAAAIRLNKSSLNFVNSNFFNDNLEFIFKIQDRTNSYFVETNSRYFSGFVANVNCLNSAGAVADHLLSNPTISLIKLVGNKIPLLGLIITFDKGETDCNVFKVSVSTINHNLALVANIVSLFVLIATFLLYVRYKFCVK